MMASRVHDMVDATESGYYLKQDALEIRGGHLQILQQRDGHRRTASVRDDNRDSKSHATRSWLQVTNGR